MTLAVELSADECCIDGRTRRRCRRGEVVNRAAESQI
jgi:hypothetical protein